MAEPALVAECVRAMREATKLPVTVKHRIGIDAIEDYEFVRSFVETVAAAGCRTFNVHARNAILKGLTPKENREIPPLRYGEVHRLKEELPELEIVINGGLRSWPEIEQQRHLVDGVMIGRAAENDPWLLAEADMRVFDGASPPPTRAQVIAAVARYAEEEVAGGTPLRHIVRHMHGLYRGRPVARRWRQMLSDTAGLQANDPQLLWRVLEAIERREFVGTEA
jgi:tRNA-dihydrouridine synthase A